MSNSTTTRTRTAATTATASPEPQRNTLGLLEERGFEISHSWEEEESTPLSAEELEEIKEIKVAQGTYSKRFDFKMKSGRVFGLNVSSTCQDYPVGTKIRPSSVRVITLYDEMEERTIYRVTGNRL